MLTSVSICSTVTMSYSSQEVDQPEHEPVVLKYEEILEEEIPKIMGYFNQPLEFDESLTFFLNRMRKLIGGWVREFPIIALPHVQVYIILKNLPNIPPWKDVKERYEPTLLKHYKNGIHDLSFDGLHFLNLEKLESILMDAYVGHYAPARREYLATINRPKEAPTKTPKPRDLGGQYDPKGKGKMEEENVGALLERSKRVVDRIKKSLNERDDSYKDAVTKVLRKKGRLSPQEEAGDTSDLRVAPPPTRSMDWDGNESSDNKSMKNNNMRDDSDPTTPEDYHD